MTNTENWARVMIPALSPYVAEIVPNVSGTRHHTLLKAARTLGRLVGGG